MCDLSQIYIDMQVFPGFNATAAAGGVVYVRFSAAGHIYRPKSAYVDCNYFPADPVAAADNVPNFLPPGL